MKLVSTAQMREMEARAAELGLSMAELMERAGLAVAQTIRDYLGGEVRGRRIVALVGPGNNGGDGLVAARHLHDWGARLQLFLSGERDQADPNYRQVHERGIPCLTPDVDPNLVAFADALAEADLVLDALLGTGRARPMDGFLLQWLQKVEEVKAKRPGLSLAALDLPSGLDADSSAIDPATPAFDLTVTLGFPKLGLVSFPGAGRVGKLVVVDIGIPLHLAVGVDTELMDDALVASILPQRPRDAHKGSFGRVLVVAGSVNYVGAAALACLGAGRVGAGLVTLATPRSLHPILAAKLTETTFIPLPEAEPGVVRNTAFTTLQENLPNYDVLLVGCGLGQAAPAQEFVRGLLLGTPSLPPLVLDADALNTLTQAPRWWERLEAPAVLTPHPGEMARLSGVSTAEVQSRRLEVAREAARAWGKVVVLKGAHTIVAAPEGQVAVSPVAHPALATAGSGDVLAGAIAGLLGQGLDPFAAAIAGVYLHGRAGEMVGEELGEAGALAGDLPPRLPQVMRRLRSGRP